MNRFLAILICIFFIKLAVVPCCHGGTHTDMEEQNRPIDQSDKKNNDCGSFCSCTCCGTSFTIPIQSDLKDSIIWILNDHQFDLQNKYSYLYSNTYWIPPAQV